MGRHGATVVRLFAGLAGIATLSACVTTPGTPTGAATKPTPASSSAATSGPTPAITSGPTSESTSALDRVRELQGVTAVDGVGSRGAVTITLAEDITGQQFIVVADRARAALPDGASRATLQNERVTFPLEDNGYPAPGREELVGLGLDERRAITVDVSGVAGEGTRVALTVARDDQVFDVATGILDSAKSAGAGSLQVESIDAPTDLDDPDLVEVDIELPTAPNGAILARTQAALARSGFGSSHLGGRTVGQEGLGWYVSTDRLDRVGLAWQAMISGGFLDKRPGGDTRELTVTVSGGPVVMVAGGMVHVRLPSDLTAADACTLAQQLRGAGWEDEWSIVVKDGTNWDARYAATFQTSATGPALDPVTTKETASSRTFLKAWADTAQP